LSRFRILVLFAALAALATTLTACGGGDGSSEDPQKVIENATLEGVESGDIDMSLSVNSEGGDKGGDLDVSLSGPFQSAGKEALPELDVAITAKGNVRDRDVDFDGNLTLLSDRAFVGYEGTEYEVDPTTFGFAKSAFEQAQEAGSRETGDVTACQDAAEGLEFSDFVENASSEGAEVDGTSTTKVSGDLNTEGAIDAIIQLTEEPACAKQLEAAGELPLDELKEEEDEAVNAVKAAHVDVYVGDDDIVRRVAAELTIEPRDSREKVEVEFDLTLSGVNESQDISAPGSAKPLEGLLSRLGIDPLELLEGGTSGLESILEGLLEDDNGGGGGGSSSGGGGSSGGGSSSGGGPAGKSQSYLECLETIESAADLQKCANLAP
jgi:hypothetical protein